MCVTCNWQYFLSGGPHFKSPWFYIFFNWITTSCTSLNGNTASNIDTFFIFSHLGIVFWFWPHVSVLTKQSSSPAHLLYNDTYKNIRGEMAANNQHRKETVFCLALLTPLRTAHYLYPLSDFPKVNDLSPSTQSYIGWRVTFSTFPWIDIWCD